MVFIYLWQFFMLGQVACQDNIFYFWSLLSFTLLSFCTPSYAHLLTCTDCLLTYPSGLASDSLPPRSPPWPSQSGWGDSVRAPSFPPLVICATQHINITVPVHLLFSLVSSLRTRTVSQFSSHTYYLSMLGIVVPQEILVEWIIKVR